MCGLTGIIAFNRAGYPYLQRIDASLISIAHRGPDHQEIHRSDNFAVGHARLSILDLSPEAHQPFFDDERNSFILHNGEIFNFPVLKKDLQSKGISFHTSSDTEVILKLFGQYGKASFEQLDGFFATVLYQGDQNTWYLVRDPYGVKPLYYYADENMVAFSSELTGLMAYGIDRTPDWDSLYAYFQLTYIPQPWTALKNVRQVRPGYYLKIDISQATIEELPYYHFPDPQCLPDKYLNEKDIQGTFARLFNHAVEKRLISDVPLGAFLSGGLDSTALVAAASTMTDKLKTFTIGFTDFPFYDESRLAEETARIFKTEHKTIALRSSDMLDIIPEVLEHCTEPFGDSSAIAVYLLSREVGKDIKVALSGDGGDELLGGYYKHRAESMLIRRKAIIRPASMLLPLLEAFPHGRHNSLSNTARQLSRFLKGAALTADERYWQWCCWKPESEVKKLTTIYGQLTDYQARKTEILKNIKKHPDKLNQILFTDLQFVLPGDMLVKADRMSMAHGLEIRSPFLDQELIRFCAPLASQCKIKGNTSKVILRKYLESKVPAHIINRPKKGFEVPLLGWLNNNLKNGWVHELFHEDFIHEQGIFEGKELNKLMHKLRSGNPGDSSLQLWNILVFQYWWKKFIA